MNRPQGLQRGDCGGGGQHILWQGNDHGAWAACGCHAPGPCHDLWNTVHLVNRHGQLGHGGEQGGKVNFLKGFPAPHMGGDIPHQHDHGRAVLHGGMDADGGIGCTWAPRHQA